MQIGRTLARGAAAGVAGTAAMTLYRQLVSRSSTQSTNGQQTWEDAPPPAKVARKVLGAVGVDLSPQRIPLVTNVVHWAYGTAWGPAYAVLDGRADANPVAEGVALGTGVWALSFAVTPVGLKAAPWRLGPGALARELSLHLVYGLGVAGAHEALARRDPPSRRQRIAAVAVAAGGAWRTLARRRRKPDLSTLVRAPRQTVRRVVPVG
jgi:hypothetical protein